LTPIELLADAVRSKQPEVLFDVGTVQTSLVSDSQDGRVRQLAWYMVACQRGLDCTSGAEWLQMQCPVMSALCGTFSDPTDYIRSMAEDHWPEVQLLSQQISDNLDSGNWDQLGLGL